MDGMFGFVTWSMWTFNGIESDWNFLIGMNQLNETNSVQGFNISREDGSLKIDKVHPCDVTSFMCKAEREMVNGTSRPPKKHYVTLRVINQKCKYFLIYFCFLFFFILFYFFYLQSHYNNDNHNNKIQKGGKKKRKAKKEKKLVPTCKIYATKLIIQLTIQRRMTYLHNITYISFLTIILPTNLTLQCR